MKRIKLSPSALSCDFSAAGAQIEKAAAGGAEYLHLDVMDGIFVPNISFGQPVVKSLRRCTPLVLDVHLMITEPIRYIDDFAAAGSDIITVHAEACGDITETLLRIRACGKKAGLSLKPGTPPESLLPYLHLCDLVLVMTVNPGFGGQKLIPYCVEKIAELDLIRKEKKYNYLISVDGGINNETLPSVLEAGVDVVVSGSAFFNGSFNWEA